MKLEQGKKKFDLREAYFVRCISSRSTPLFSHMLGRIFKRSQRQTGILRNVFLDRKDCLNGAWRPLGHLRNPNPELKGLVRSLSELISPHGGKSHDKVEDQPRNHHLESCGVTESPHTLSVSAKGSAINTLFYITIHPTNAQ